MDDREFLAKQMRRFFEIVSQKVALDDSTAMEIADLYEPWEAGKAYESGKTLKYGTNDDGETQLYIVLQGHTSQDDWRPDTAVSLYKKLGISPSGYPIWTQPLGASDAYQTGDIVEYNGKNYRSTVDNNVWQPDVYGWEEV